MRKLLRLASVVPVIAGCSAGGPSVTTGAIPGANPTAVVGSPVGTGTGDATVGAVEGGLMGADVGLSLNDADREIALKA
jgi:hypothetical protein